MLFKVLITLINYFINLIFLFHSLDLATRKSEITHVAHIMFLLSSTILESHRDTKVYLFIQHVCWTLCQPLGIQYGQPYQALAGSHTF